jgi:hypothetical protein
LYHVTLDHPDRQIWKGLARKKGIPGKDERYLDNKVKRLPCMEKRKSVLIIRMKRSG